MRCSSCGNDLEVAARFCSNCGTPQVASDEERRVVTVLFADIVGFTGLAESLDPEDVKHLVDRCVEAVAADIVSFGGVVDKVLGDAVVALFGAPIAHEDDAERAVRAGLRMQQTLSALAAETEHDLQMRVGINSGEVLVGMSSAGGDYTAMGDVMNIASRLEELAEPGHVLVGPATYTATKEAISYRPVGEVSTRGREAVVETWEALSPVRPPGARTRRMTPFAGRQREIEVVEAQARLAIDLGRAQTTTIIGESGMGKTRLAEEIAGQIALRTNARVLEGRAVPYGESNVWWPVAEILRHAFGLDVETDADNARSAILGGLSIRLAATQSSNIPRYTVALMHALGFSTPLEGGDRERNRSEVTLALISVLEAELVERPVVLVLSDVHWAAEAVWSLLEHVMHELARCPLIVLMTAKSAETPLMIPGRHGSLVLPLGPLEPAASRAIVDDLGLDLPSDVVDKLVERSGGNPFFLEELTSLVAGEAASERGQSGFLSRLANGHLDVLPDNLRGLIAARLDAIDPTHRAVLEAASVLGSNGPLGGLATMVRESSGIDDIGPAIADLVDRDLLLLEGPRYQFRSQMVRDVAYGTLTKTSRAQSHFEIANYLEHSGEFDSSSSIVVPIAEHYRAAAEIVIEMNSVAGIDRAGVVAKALHWLNEAGERALAEGAPPDASAWFSHGLEIATDDQDRATFALGRARARSEIRDLAGARSDLDRIETLVVHDPVLHARALLVRGEIDRKSGRLESAANRLRESAERLEALGEPSHQALALRLLGVTEMSRGGDALGRRALDSSRAVAAAAGDTHAEAWALQSLGWHAFRLGNLADARRWVDDAVQMFTQLDDRGGLAWARGLEAWVAFHRGDWTRARALIDEVLPETQRRGDPWPEAVMLILSSSLELWSGNAVRARELSREASEVAVRAEDVSLRVQAQAIEGRSLVSIGRVAEGTAMLEQAYTMVDRDGDADARRIAVVTITASAARVGESDRAIRWAARFDGQHSRPSLLGESELAVSLALALVQRGSVDEAASQLAWIGSDGDTERIDTFALAVGAIIASAQGHAMLAQSRVDAVIGADATYLDRAMALGAQAALHHKLGAAAECQAALDLARVEVAMTDDRITPLVLDVAAAACGRSSMAHAEIRLRGMGVDPAGWRRAWELAAESGTVRSAPTA